MKLTLLLSLILLINVNASIYSQNSRITIYYEETLLENVLEEIKEQSEFTFLYRSDLLKGVIVKDINLKRQKVNDVLEKVLLEQGYEYEIIDKTIIIRKTALNKKSESQQDIVEGRVVDSEGNTLPGVNIVEVGTTNGAVTDLDGNYSISVSSPNAVLSFSFVGYLTEEIEVNNKANIEVVLIEDIQSLDEVVVVGYSTQKRINLTGSISTIDSKELTATPMPTLAQSAMGRASGVFIKNVNGQPGDDSGIDINIRGFGKPLIIIDGMPASEWDFQQLDPNDIEDFNVLKDAAAAAVYGARAGNGVILVTTKRGIVSEAKFTYTGNYGLQFFCVVPDFVSSAQYAEMENLAQLNQGLEHIWTEDQINKFRDGSDPINYPNVNWWNETLRAFAPQTQHNINVRGGTERVKYFVSAGYFHQDGMLKSDDISNNRYTLRSNIDVNLAKNLKVGVDISMVNQDYIGPRNQLERSGEAIGIMTRIFRARPYFSNLPYPDPTKVPTNSDAQTLPTVLSEMDYSGYRDWTKLLGDAKLNFSYKLPHGFKLRAIFDFQRTYYRYKEKTAKVPLYTYDWEDDEYTLVHYTNAMSQLIERIDINNNINQQYFLTWDKEFKDHNLGLLFVYEQLSDNYDYFQASRQNYDFDLDYLFAGPDLDKSNYGYALEGGRKAFISRLNYNYKGKYLVELNSRYDASPYFPPETRWGFFPSASIGWRISEEPFLQNLNGFLSNLKLRASYGRLGYDHSDESSFEKYQYLATYSISSSYIYDGMTNELSKGIRGDALPNLYITWEKMYTTNAGIDFALWNNKIEGTLDYFYRLRTDVLETRSRSIPDVVGADLPKENYAEYDNRGLEASLTYRGNFGDFAYSLGGNVSWNREKYINVDQEDFASMEVYRRWNKIGEWSDYLWLYPTDGLFTSMEEIQNWADIDGKNNATIRPGDVKYLDSNGDGRISDDDMIIAGRGSYTRSWNEQFGNDRASYPRFTYGINMSAEWKGIDLSMLWQGAGLFNYVLKWSPDFGSPFYAGNTPISAMYNNAYVPENPWIEDNTDSEALYPLYRTDGYNRSHKSFYGGADYWMVNGAYLRLKNIQLGYTLPKSITQRWSIDKCKIYVSGYNVLTFSELDFLDPEVDTNPERTFGDYYPPVGIYNLGLTLQF